MAKEADQRRAEEAEAEARRKEKEEWDEFQHWKASKAAAAAPAPVEVPAPAPVAPVPVPAPAPANWMSQPVGGAQAAPENIGGAQAQPFFVPETAPAEQPGAPLPLWGNEPPAPEAPEAPAEQPEFAHQFATAPAPTIETEEQLAAFRGSSISFLRTTPEARVYYNQAINDVLRRFEAESHTKPEWAEIFRGMRR